MEEKKKKTRRHVNSTAARFGMTRITKKLELELYSWKFPKKLYYKIVNSGKYDDKEKYLPFKEIKKAISTIVTDIYYIANISESALDYIWIYSLEDNTEEIKDIIGNWISEELKIENVQELEELTAKKQNIAITPEKLLGNQKWIFKTIYLSHIANSVANKLNVIVQEGEEEREISFNVVQNPGSDKQRIVGKNIKPFIKAKREYYFTYYMDFIIDDKIDKEYPVLLYKPGLCRILTNIIRLRDNNVNAYLLLSEKSNEGKSNNKIRIIEVPIISPYSKDGKRIKLENPDYDIWTLKALDKIGVNLPEINELFSEPLKFLQNGDKSIMIRASSSIRTLSNTKQGLDFVNRSLLIEKVNNIVIEEELNKEGLIILDKIEGKEKSLDNIGNDEEKNIVIGILSNSIEINNLTNDIICGLEDIEWFNNRLNEIGTESFKNLSILSQLKEKFNINLEILNLDFKNLNLAGVKSKNELIQALKSNFNLSSIKNIDNYIVEIESKEYYEQTGNFDPKNTLRQEFCKLNKRTQFINPADFSKGKYKENYVNLMGKIIASIKDILRQKGIIPYDIDSFWIKQKIENKNTAYIGLKYDKDKKDLIIVAVYKGKIYAKSSDIDWIEYDKFLLEQGKILKSELKEKDYLINSLISLKNLCNIEHFIVFAYDNFRLIDKKYNEIFEGIKKVSDLYDITTIVKVLDVESSPEWEVLEKEEAVPSSRGKGLFKYSDNVYFNIAPKVSTTKKNLTLEKLDKGKIVYPEEIFRKEKAQVIQIIKAKEGIDNISIAKLNSILRSSSIQYDDYTYYPLPLHLANLAFEYCMKDESKEKRRKINYDDVGENEITVELDDFVFEIK
ncbi:pPIWI_RE module domain-containing protein [Clostridium beijerinckii]|uniref:DUF3893 domain-containing protein n=1 Tax=Clostridium beijerinckii TaxID=1520 RepID=A0A1S9N6Z0_CLOBE|nr:DUF3962 domain-containing protein [Clostridium beijerinckii]OOP73198.1 hypothetical protein CBEIBR21_09180 [Clostridium beijerinckii]